MCDSKSAKTMVYESASLFQRNTNEINEKKMRNSSLVFGEIRRRSGGSTAAMGFQRLWWFSSGGRGGARTQAKEARAYNVLREI